ncbi:tRNA/rRNA methyltransferase (SpoU) [Leptothrix cholodnii SP-6]|uniref:tRNA/rRNA methyltransferase (SpoU) n=1 Tax=Leptothrix cholodnii (strain ATCC 51168 / LMG 8142 / SP-6) TaxID=395495 RepID=B1XXI0_LEPCP|nr:RNA methyltransferase [Leptothrix cholodnii]ACB35100.1 tRNA/rRNA methyltransferase (SpoU) [Leptothrix cholodnii SP-6]
MTQPSDLTPTPVSAIAAAHKVREVSSHSHALVKDLRRLAHEAGAYRKLGRIWLEGDHLARALLARGGRPQICVVGASAWLQPNWRELALAAPEVVVIADNLLPEISSLESPAPLGFLIAAPAARVPTQSGVNTLVLDRLQDPGNVGTLLRSAAALGVKQVLAMKGTAALWSPKVLRAGMGAHFALHLVEGVEVNELDTLDLPLLATSSHAEQSLHEVRLPQPCAWVLGHEGQGVAEAVMRRCALTVRIPQPGGEESLNVAAAAAICLYESARQALTG